MEDNTVKREAKKARRNAKSALTRRGNTLNNIIENNRSTEEVKEALKQMQEEYDNVEKKHEAFIEQVEDDDEFAKEEEWIEECRERTLMMKFKANDYLKVVSTLLPGTGKVSDVQEKVDDKDKQEEEVSVVVVENPKEHEMKEAVSQLQSTETTKTTESQDKVANDVPQTQTNVIVDKGNNPSEN